MQNMCNNNQNNDLGTYGSQYNQVNYGLYDATYATSPAVTPEFGGGMFAATSPSLALPPLNYTGGVSPQMVPMGYPAFSPPPLMSMNSIPSVSPPMGAPMGFLPPVSMMGYSVIPVPQGNMTFLGLAPQPSGSISSDSMFLLPEMLNPGSISRSCSPAMSDEQLLAIDFSDKSREITRERRLTSDSSIGSIDSTGTISKKELVENCLNEIDQIFGERVQIAGMRGPTVMRIKVKTRPALELIVELLRALEQQCNITAISCPKSTKKGKQHIRGFLAYIQTNNTAEIDQVQMVFDAFNLAHTSDDGVAPFKTLEVNPQKKKN